MCSSLRIGDAHGTANVVRSDGQTISPTTATFAPMTGPNTLIFVDLPSDDPEASGTVLRRSLRLGGRRPPGRCVPPHRARRPLPARATAHRRRSATSTWASTTSPTPARTPTRPASSRGAVSDQGRTARVWILVSDDDSDERILDTAVGLGATELWRHHYWAEFNGFNSAFLDPWGNTLDAVDQGRRRPVVPEGWTRE